MSFFIFSTSILAASVLKPAAEMLLRMRCQLKTVTPALKLYPWYKSWLLVNWLVVGSMERPHCKPVLVLKSALGYCAQRFCFSFTSATCACTPVCCTEILLAKAYSTQRRRSQASWAYTP